MYSARPPRLVGQKSGVRQVAKRNRDDFTEKTKLQIAKRAGWLCSFPTCRTPTIGATSDGEGEINIDGGSHMRGRSWRPALR